MKAPIEFSKIKVHDNTNGADCIGTLLFKTEAIVSIEVPTSFYKGYDGKERRIVTMTIGNLKYRVDKEELEKLIDS